MNTKQFSEVVEHLMEGYFKTGFLNHIQEYNLTGAEIAMLQAQLIQTASQTALALQDADLKEQKENMEQEKIRQELQMAITKAQVENLKLLMDAISAGVQAESVKESITQNAAINRANGYISLFNVAMNAIANSPASLEGVLGQIREDVESNLQLITSKPIPSRYSDALASIFNDALALKDLTLGGKQVAILAPKTKLRIGESVTLLGMHIFGNNDCEFISPDGTSQSKFLVFQSNTAGNFEITFRAKDKTNKWISDKLTLKVLKTRKRDENE